MCKRIQRRRVKGWRMPKGAVYVGRGSKWGNPFVTCGDGIAMTPELATDGFRQQLLTEGAWFPVPFPWPKGKIPTMPPTTLEDVRRELRGKDLACWCKLVDEDGKPVPCHADVLLDLAADDAGKED